MLSTEKIRRKFHGSAKQYDAHNQLHRQIADRVLAHAAGKVNPKACLDVGCGTGYVTLRLKEQFPASRVVGVDFAAGMLEVAGAKHPDIDWVLADSQQLPFADETFDLVMSNSAYHWAADLTKAFGEARRVLVADGWLAGTLFGHNTCQELFYSLNQVKTGLQFTRLPDKVNVQQALMAAGFLSPIVTSHETKLSFGDMYELMAWIKAIGANHMLRQGFLGGQALTKAASIYKENFSHQRQVKATFEVIGIYAQK